MCLTTTAIYEKDLEYISDVQEEFDLKSHAAAIRKIVKRVKQLAPSKVQMREDIYYRGISSGRP